MAQWLCLPSWHEQSTISPVVMETKVSALQVRTGWLVRAERGTVGKNCYFTATFVPTVAAFSHTKQINNNEKDTWFEWVHNVYDSNFLQRRGLGGFPDNPGKSENNKQDTQNTNIMPDLKQLSINISIKVIKSFQNVL